jgi:16S rRNA (cytidine1402-2'-O)-methyltransferase
MTGTLYLIATPIGNLQDISLRALEILKSVDIVACEDTRHTGKLLHHFQITKKLISYHEHNEQKRADELSDLLKIGKSIAVVTDAGTPGISDPSFRIVQKAHEIGAKVTPIPGAVAFVNALIASGLPTDSFYFGGFLPSRKGERRKALETVKDLQSTLVFYESPHRIGKSLTDALKVLGNRKICVAREITKLHEEFIFGELEELAERFTENTIKGEIVLVIDRNIIISENTEINLAESIPARVRELENEGVHHKKALKQTAREFGLSKSEAYKIVLDSKTE